MEIASSTGDGVSCGTGAFPGSGSGVVLHPMQPQGRPPRLDFVDRAGTQVGSFDEFSISTFDLGVIPQTTGFGIFAPYVGGLGRYPVALVDDHGVRRGGAAGFAAPELPGGGVGVFSFLEMAPGCGQDTRLFVQRFDDSGSAALPDPTDLGCYPQINGAVMAGNGSGDVLVLVARNTASATGWDAFWLEADLRVVEKFSTQELVGAVNNKDAAVAALLDGSFVLRFDGHWVYRIQPRRTSVEPAPCWLTQAPGTNVQVTRGRSAYALVQSGAKSCDDAVEVRTAEGQSCGHVGPIEKSGETCEVALGRDGTISGSANAVDAGAGQPRACVLKFWPAALGETRF